ASDGNLADAHLLAVDRQRHGPRSALAQLEVGRTGDFKVTAQGQLALRQLVLGNDLVLLKTQVIMRVLQLVVLVDEERDAGEAASLRQQDPLSASLGNVHFSRDTV